MSRYSLEVRILKPIPKKYRNLTAKAIEQVPKELNQCYGNVPDLNDRWHIPLTVINHYCSIDDLKKWLLVNHPDLNLNNSWSMTGGYQKHDVTVTDHDGKKIVIPYSVYDGLKSPHEDKTVYEILEKSWNMELPYGNEEWLSKLLPTYLTKSVLNRLVRSRMAWSDNSAPEELSEHLDWNSGYCPQGKDILGFVSDTMAYAKQKGCIAYTVLQD